MLCINNMKNEFLKRGGSGGNAAPLPDQWLNHFNPIPVRSMLQKRRFGDGS
jgi:hypothetical protein